jgi:hypothetical protein
MTNVVTKKDELTELERARQMTAVIDRTKRKSQQAVERRNQQTVKSCRLLSRHMLTL